MATRQLKKIAQKALNALECPECELSISLISDRTMQRLNAKWRRKNKTTDVLSFPMQELGESNTQCVLNGCVLGDVVINADAAARQAVEIGHSFDEEVIRLFVHGLVHLFGYDHELGRREAAKMRAVERKVLGQLG